MKYFEITGGAKLSGEIKISGAKNASLPIIASTLLGKSDITLTNVPEVVDIYTLLELLEDMGSTFSFKDNIVTINSNIKTTKAKYDIVKKLRASILVLGPLLGRYRKCQVSFPGGCAIGQRPVDLHLSALEKMGANFIINDGYIDASAPNGLKGAKIVFDKITVGGSENLIMASSMAKGTTILSNVAIEPEVVQLCEFIRDAGVDIKGIGTNELKIIGTDGEPLEYKECKIISDRIEAGTYLCAAGITNSSIKLNNINHNLLSMVLDKLEEVGFSFTVDDDSIVIHKAERLKSVNISTSEFPGFPTDMQAQFMSLLTQCEGTSTIEERLFENRFMHVPELNRMGADISLNGRVAKITGPKKLSPANVMASDLRASSALVLASLVASGTSKVDRIYHLDRGYEDFEKKLKVLGVNITRKG